MTKERCGLEGGRCFWSVCQPTSLLANRIGYTHATFEQLQANREVPAYGNLDVEAYGQTDTLIDDFLSEVFCQQNETDEDWDHPSSAGLRLTFA